MVFSGHYLCSLLISAQLGVSESWPGPQDHRADP